MNLEQQVCSLELAKRLKELGIEQNSLFYWTNTGNTMGFIDEKECSIWEHKTDMFDNWSAFTVAELGELFGSSAASGKDKLGGYFCRAYAGDDFIVFDDLTEANARAKMLIYLIENKLIEVPNG